MTVKLILASRGMPKMSLTLNAPTKTSIELKDNINNMLVYMSYFLSWAEQ
jgi:hypothetical protein